MHKRILIVVLLIVITIVLASCFPGSKEMTDKPAGLLLGIWHGWIAPVSLVASLFTSKVDMYEVNNVGFWYDFGFYIAIIGGFGSISLSRKNKKTHD